MPVTTSFLHTVPFLGPVKLITVSSGMLAHADTHQPVIHHIGAMSVGVEGHALVTRTGGRCTEIRRSYITTPTATLLVTITIAITSVTGNEEAGVERSIADQQLVGVNAVHGSHTVPQSISATNLSIVASRRYGHLGATFEVGLVSSLVINEDDFCKLKRKQYQNVERREVST